MTTYAASPAENLILNLPDSVRGFKISYASGPTLTVAAGICRDSTGVFDLILPAAVTIDSGRVGLPLGLDTGTLGASTVYAVYIIADSHGKNVTSCLFSASYTAPTLPGGYNIYRRIGWCVTDGSTDFAKLIHSGNGLSRRFEYDLMQSVLSGGHATTYTAIDLSAFVPNVTDIPVTLNVRLTPASAGNAIQIRQSGSSSTVPPTISGPVAAKVKTGSISVLVGLESSLAKVDYILSNGSDAATIYVQSFTDYL